MTRNRTKAAQSETVKARRAREGKGMRWKARNPKKIREKETVPSETVKAREAHEDQRKR